QKWEEISQQERGLRIDLVARRHLADLDGLATQEKRFRELFEELARVGELPVTLQGLEAAAFEASRFEEVGGLLMARERFPALREQASQEPPQRFWSLFASVESRKVKDQLKKKPQTGEDRKLLVRKLLKDVAARLEQPNVVLRDQRVVCLDVVALYDK